MKVSIHQLVVLCLLALCASAQEAPIIFEDPLSPRIANYRIHVTLDEANKRISGSQMLLWHNKNDEEISDLRFHLYLNGFRNSQATFMKESGGVHRGNKIDEEGWGYSDITMLKVQNHGGPAEGLNFSDGAVHPTVEDMVDRTNEIQFLAPDDGNTEDRTYFAVPLEQPLKPGESVWVKIEFEAKLPEPPFSRTGAWKDYFFVAQWFPKIAVREEGAWTDHQFHVNTEFYADYGVYDVFMTVPDTYVLGATGLNISKTDNGDGTKTHYYHAEDVHDFAWTASPDFLEFTGKADDVEIRALVQKEHADQGQRHIDATVVSITKFQEWYGDYPFPNLTVVDPRRGATGSGGMEYPTLITAGTFYGMPEKFRPLEIVIIHEFGHNFWYHLLASNEFEESWLDEGINSYTEIQVMQDAYGDNNVMDLYGIRMGDVHVQRMGYAGSADLDPTVRDGWTYSTRNSYGVNSYSKPAIFLTTLHNHLGKEKMLEVMRTYVERFSFKHPKSQDFVDVVNDVTGEDYSWFFDQALYTAKTLDYKVSRATSKRIKPPKGYGISQEIGEDIDRGKEAAKEQEDKSQPFASEVLIRRVGEFTFPVTLEVVFEDGETIRENWDGKDLWKRYTYERPSRMVSAAIDPDYLIPMDLNMVNNSIVLEKDSEPVAKHRLNWMVRIQTILEMLAL
jgi:hypothetical protein